MNENKVKNFWEENKENVKHEVSRALWLVIGVGAGYCIGNQLTMMKIENGINKCIIAKPELDTMIRDAMALVAEKKESNG